VRTGLCSGSFAAKRYTDTDTRCAINSLAKGTRASILNVHSVVTSVPPESAKLFMHFCVIPNSIANPKSAVKDKIQSKFKILNLVVSPFFTEKASK
jgi:hypothetical protein